ncbi:LysR substrate-binding domain-containing protein [Oceanimonas pelagia]|uniref:LysR substrate-binding domain-containing protein n=1 Tax=Oceanimonas pelagia TaxID=3028314 RepID=A0AA50KKR3_9GAMM|nr:LysR substrate-binding domain-containing protein [Oceanimonas pelagia]WMC09946.1 LysR substrate-binding domain-containing protein [Oceanimonas pelagia]
MFAVAARHGSYSAAASELCVTQAAVSQQIRNLEASLGCRLFVRRGAGMVLTSAGRELLPFAEQGLATLERGLARLEHAAGPLQLSVLPSLAARWLMPRLWRFAERHPRLELRLHPSQQLADFAGGEVDLAIRYGEGNYAGLHSEWLMSDTAFPVCSPALAARLQRVEDLISLPLVAGPEYAGVSWANWLALSGHEHILPRCRQLTVDDGNLGLEMVLAGQGVALSRSVLVADLLRQGRLCRPFASELTPKHRYYLVWRPDSPRLDDIATVRDWLKQEALQDRE